MVNAGENLIGPDPLLALALNMRATPGAYALLLGSGLSRQAGLPTGWEVTLDLVSRLATLEGQPATIDLARWYADRYGTEPRYSELLRILCSTPSERQRILRSYFEPTPEEREAGAKQPTRAHHAIARLIEGGFVRVVITTNFDTLLEQALEAVGIHPDVISTPDATLGALPLTFSRCTIVKPNGSYLDSRIKNSEDELSRYDRRIDRLLDRIFDEFGLLVAGWSADWDVALRQALERCKSHRFTTYWAYRSQIGATAAPLVHLRRAVELGPVEADELFTRLADNLASLSDLESRTHPLSPKVAVATVKRLLPGAENRIRLHDLLIDEVERVRLACDVGAPISNHRDQSVAAMNARVALDHQAATTLAAMTATVAYWDVDGLHSMALTRLMSRLADHGDAQSGTSAWIDRMGFPAIWVLYAGGIASMAAKNYDAFAAIVVRAQWRKQREVMPVGRVEVPAVLAEFASRLPDQINMLTPESNYLFAACRAWLRELIPSDEEYSDAFDRFEYMLSLTYSDFRGEDAYPGVWVGRYGRTIRGRRIAAQVDEEADEEGGAWTALGAGLFGGTFERLLPARQRVAQRLASLGSAYGVG